MNKKNLDPEHVLQAKHQNKQADEVIIIAVDGPTAAGKGTIARKLAQHLGFACLDTGLLYRAVAVKALENKINWEVGQPSSLSTIARKLTPLDLSHPALRDEIIGRGASIIAAIPEVRSALLDFQRRFHLLGKPVKGVVLDGRDIGTVVYPNAHLKLFITASQQVRAERRYKELLNRGLPVIYAQVLLDVQERDNRDQKRSSAPLIPATDAIIIDSSSLNADQVLAIALQHAHKKLGLS